MGFGRFEVSHLVWVSLGLIYPKALWSPRWCTCHQRSFILHGRARHALKDSELSQRIMSAPMPDEPPVGFQRWDQSPERFSVILILYSSDLSGSRPRGAHIPVKKLGVFMTLNIWIALRARSDLVIGSSPSLKTSSQTRSARTPL